MTVDTTGSVLVVLLDSTQELNVNKVIVTQSRVTLNKSPDLILLLKIFFSTEILSKYMYIFSLPKGQKANMLYFYFLEKATL